MRNIFALVFIIIFCVSKSVGQKNMNPQFSKNTPLSGKVDSVLSQNIFKAPILLIGESHYCVGNESIKKTFFNEYIKRINNVLIIEELPISYIYFIQKYIKTGDDTLLKKSIERNGYTFINQYLPYREMFLSLPDSVKFDVFGLSTEDITWIPVYALLDILRPFEENVLIKNDYKSIQNVFKNSPLPNKQYFLELSSSLYTNIERNKKTYSEILGNSFFFYERILRGIIVGIEHPIKKYSAKSATSRELFMYETMLKIISNNPGNGIFCQMGRIHIDKNSGSWLGLDNWKSIANYLNESDDSPLKGKVSTLMIYYYNAKKIERRTLNYKFLNKKQKQYIKSVAPNLNDFLIINICDKNSFCYDYCGNIDGIIINNFSNGPN